MKFNAVLQAVTCSAAIATLPAWAQTASANSAADPSSAFVFSTGYPGFTGFASLSMVSISSVAPATVVMATDDANGDATGSPYATYVAGVSAPVTGFTIGASNEIVSISSQGGFSQTTLVSAASTGGTLTIANFSYNPTTNIISADVSGHSNTGYDLPTTTEQLFSVTTLQYSGDGGTTWIPIENPTALSLPAVGNVELAAGGLFLVGGDTGAAFNQIVNALGLQNGAAVTGLDLYVNNPRNNPAGFGTLITNFSLQTVPEPSVGLILGCGLAGCLSMSARRKRC